MTIAVPKDTDELKAMMSFSETYNHPLAIRYPRAGQVLFDCDCPKPIQVGKWEYLHRANAENDAKVTVLAAGERCLLIAMKISQKLQAQGIDFDIVNARFVKPLDEELLKGLTSEYVITMEDNVALGGFGSVVNNKWIELGKAGKIKNFAYRDEFIHQGSVSALQAEYGVNCKEIEQYILDVIHES
jgi:1-deoxy-D-xylulose-5-phosphate synthase